MVDVINRLSILLDRIKLIQSSGDGIVYLFKDKAFESFVFCQSTGLQVSSDAKKRCFVGGLTSEAKEKRVQILLKLLPQILEFLRNDKSVTKRDLYYNHKELYGTQRVLDSMIEDIARLINVPRICLSVVATSKGLVAGDLSYVDCTGNLIDCSNTKEGILISSDVDSYSQIQTKGAKVILVVEKDAVFQRILADSVMDHIGHAIIITGKGYPDQGTRRLVRRLWDDLKLPVFALVDADPHGVEIFFTYKYGSMSMAKECKRLATPAMKCIGVHPSDFERLLVSKDSLLPLSPQDIRKITALESRPYIKDDNEWKNQISIMKRLGVKAEIEALVSISPKFLTEVYLPSKIRAKGWI
ncbi:meiotic recombination protein SPO11-like isoform X3 [Artemia franciscana]|uniref:DNA topoisomerase (ATP-hydrolyzing) n=1 Tax=Artemia franciscana TaxID=6661 RepID=A0AA88HET2_ARTSF|nr:hypothetical protein QYM36_017577 [Artemia franciscana]